MGRQHEGHALLLEPEQPLPHQMPGLRVEARGGFVQQQQPGEVDQSAGNGQPPLHPARQRLDLRVGPVGQRYEREQLVRAGATLRSAEPEEPAVYDQVLPHPKLRVHGVLLRADADASPDLRSVGHRIQTEHPQLAAGRRRHGPIMRIVDDFPAPFGPRKPNASPRRTSTSIPRTASKSPKRFTNLTRPDQGFLHLGRASGIRCGRSPPRFIATSR